MKSGEVWRKAASMCAKMHKDQLRKDGETPYAAHPFRVAMTVRHEFGCSDDVAIAAALLHDVIEDTRADFDEIAEECGADVAAIVAALTKDMRLVEHEREPAYDAGLAAADWRARLIKLGDVLDNLRDIEKRGDRGRMKKHLARCDRAIELARGDAAAHPEVEAALQVLKHEIGLT